MNLSVITSTASNILSATADVAARGWSYVQPIANQAQNLSLRVYNAAKPYLSQLWEILRTPIGSGSLALCGAFCLLKMSDDRTSFVGKLPYQIAALTCAVFAGFFFGGVPL
jgi:hypothetical protein